MHRARPRGRLDTRPLLVHALAAAGLLILNACQAAAPAAAPTSAPATGAPTAAATAKPASVASSPMPASASASPSPLVAPSPSAAVAATSSAASAAGQPLKVGVLLSQSGPFVFEGTGGIEAINLYLEQVNNMLGGRPVTMIYEDTAGRPDDALTKAKKLVEQDRVDMLIGPVGSNEALAIRDYIDQQNIPTFFSYTIAKDITQNAYSPYVFRVGGSLQLSSGGGWLAAKKLNYRSAIIVSADYAAGHDAADNFKQYFENAGGKVVDQIFPPLGVTDVAPYITRVQGELDSADVVVLPQIVGDTAIQWIKSWDQFGLKDQKPLFAAGVSVDDASTLPPEGDSAVGIQNYAEWAATLSLPANQAFVSAYRAKYKKEPGQHNYLSYMAIKVMDEGLKANNGNTADKRSLVNAIEKVQFDGPAGAFKFDEKHQAIITVYLRVVQKQGDQLVNTVLDEVDGVSQFWQAP